MIARARARQARSRSAAVDARTEQLGERVEQLWRHHHEQLVATLWTQAPISNDQHQAIGMLVLIFGVTPGQAGQLLALLSWHHRASPEMLAQEMVAACIRDTAPGAARPDPSATPLTVRRAVAFIDAHLRDDITVDDISSASGISQRALQHAFRRHLGISPTRYLRSVRMEHAHRQLLAADPAHGDTVAAIAETWRFTHHGRFALDFRATYGSSPAEVLRH
jgi:AraC-like DNA-binding protein